MNAHDFTRPIETEQMEKLDEVLLGDLTTFPLYDRRGSWHLRAARRDRQARDGEAIPSIREVHVPGLHVEAPFMAIAGAACPTLPGDLALLEEILAVCRGRLAVMSVSPDTPDILPVIRRLHEALLRWLSLPPAQVWAMGTSNPARVLGLSRKGRLAVGADADLVLWDNDFRPVKTWAGGECTYEKDQTAV